MRGPLSRQPLSRQAAAAAARRASNRLAMQGRNITRTGSRADREGGRGGAVGVPEATKTPDAIEGDGAAHAQRLS